MAKKPVMKEETVSLAAATGSLGDMKFRLNYFEICGILAIVGFVFWMTSYQGKEYGQAAFWLMLFGFVGVFMWLITHMGKRARA